MYVLFVELSQAGTPSAPFLQIYKKSGLFRNPDDRN